MAMAIDSLMSDPGPGVFYSGAFQRVLETHLKYLREHPDTSALPINPHDTYKYEGDLNGLLRKSGISPQFHWVVMRLNGMTNVNQLDGSVTHLLIPSTRILEEIRQRFMSTLPKRKS